MVVPLDFAISLTLEMSPALASIMYPLSELGVFVESLTMETDAMLASASPRKPSVEMLSKSSTF